MRGSLYGWLGVVLCLVAACSFDSGGVADDDIDANGPGDADGDGVGDASDNCVDVENADQRDEDGDDVGNACDNCPHVVNADQLEVGEASLPDGVGDSCDPQPSTPGNSLLYFEGFDEPAALDDWRVFNGGLWSISGGALHQDDPIGFHTLYLGAQSFQGAQVNTRFVLDTVAPSSGPTDSNRGFGALLGFSTASAEGAGYLCLGYFNPTIGAGSAGLHFITLRGSSPYQTEDSEALNASLVQDGSYDLRQSLDAGTGALACDVRSTSLPGDVALSGIDTTYTQGLVGLKTQYVAAHIDYVAVFSLVD